MSKTLLSVSALRTPFFRWFLVATILPFSVLKMTGQAYIRVEDASDKLELVYTDDYIFTKKQTIEQDKKVRLDVDDIKIFTLKKGDKEYPLFLEKHDDMDIKFEGDEIKFERHGAANNVFFQIYMNEAQKDQTAKQKSLDAVEISAFEFRKKMEKLMKEYPKFDFVTSRFRQYLDVENEYRYQTSILRYGVDMLRAHRIPDEMIPTFTRMGYTDEDRMESKWYREFIYYYTAFMAMRDNGFAEVSNKTGMYVLHSYWINQNVSDLSVYNIDYEVLKRYAPDMDPVILYNRMEVYEKEKGETIEKLRDYVAAYARKEVAEKEELPESGAGSTNQNLMAVDLKGKEVSLSEFDNKIVYMDIWASWCGPCRKEFQSVPKLKSGLSKKARKKIVFLYVSIDDDEKKWKSAVEKLKLEEEGEIWRSEGGWSSDVVRMFSVSGIPRYVIFKEGKIVEIQAPRPSNPKTIELLNGLVR